MGGGMGGAMNFEDLINAFGQGMRQPRQQLLEVQLALEDFYAGASRKFAARLAGGRREFELRVEPGMPAGARVALDGGIVLQVNERPHAKFARDGDHLHVRLSLSLYEALTGFRRQIKQLDGRTIWVTSADDRAVTRPGTLRRLRGFGMPRFRSVGKGDLYLRFDVRFPEHAVSAEADRLLREVLKGSAGTASPFPPEHQRLHRLETVPQRDDDR